MKLINYIKCEKWQEELAQEKVLLTFLQEKLLKLMTLKLPSNAISLKRTQLQIISREYWEPDQIKLTKTKV